MRLGMEVISAGETTENAFPSRNRYIHYFCNINVLGGIESDLFHEIKKAGLYLPAGENSFSREVPSKSDFIFHYPKGAPGISIFLCVSKTICKDGYKHI